ncbi:MAG: HAD family hydrolase [Chloroflexota bacterium]|nr:HAD family hydrolase [Chloroflexota bacterium]
MPLDIPRIKALCFDVDGTLSDTDDLYANAFSRFLPRFLFRNPAHTARRLVMWIEAPGNALLGMADTVGLDQKMVAFLDWMSRHRKLPQKKYLLVPGVDILLERLKGRYPMSIISAREEKSTLRFLDQFDLLKYFDVVVTGLSTIHTKPYPHPILFAAQNMGVKPEECLMIGDTTVDMRAGKAADAQTVGVLCGFGEKDELLKMGADLILNSTNELADALSIEIPKSQ